MSDTFKRDLIIATIDPESKERVLYQIPEEAWRQASRPSPMMAASLNTMLNQGAILTAVPQMGGIGMACYLVNLASINVDPWNSDTK
jgi:hypothetical protein